MIDFQACFGASLRFYQADISNTKALVDVFAQITKSIDHLDILVNAAGFDIPTSSSHEFNIPLQNWNAVIGTNLTGAFMVSMLAVPLLSKLNGRIINISSIGAFTGGSAAGGIAYATSKVGLNGLTFALAKELSSSGVTVNSIAPGFIDNTGFTASFPDDKVRSIIQEVPANRTGTVDDIAALCYFLTSKEVGYVNGQVIQVNGGWLFSR